MNKCDFLATYKFFRLSKIVARNGFLRMWHALFENCYYPQIFNSLRQFLYSFTSEDYNISLSTLLQDSLLNLFGEFDWKSLGVEHCFLILTDIVSIVRMLFTLDIEANW